jgi:hypothetical protein
MIEDIKKRLKEGYTSKAYGSAIIAKEQIKKDIQKQLDIVSSGVSVVDSVVGQYKERSIVGQAKYKTTLDRKDLSFEEWITHLKEELMDATLYAEKVSITHKHFNRI